MRRRRRRRWFLSFATELKMTSTDEGPVMTWPISRILNL